VVQEVWYLRENAGIAFPEGTTRISNDPSTRVNTSPKTSLAVTSGFVST